MRSLVSLVLLCLPTAPAFGRVCALHQVGPVGFIPEATRHPAPLPAHLEGHPLPETRRSLPAGTYILALKAENTSDHPATCVFLPDQLAALVELFTADGTQVVARSGWALPLEERALKSPRTVLPAVLPPGETRFWVRLWVPPDAPRQAASFALAAQPLEDFVAATRRHEHINGLYGGVMLAVVLYNLFLFFSLRERLYLLYVLYASCFGAIWLVRAGMALTFLWPRWPLWDAQAHYFLIGLALVFGNAFAGAFLELPRFAPRLARALKIMSWVVLAILVGAALQRFSLIEKPLALATLAICGLYLTAGILRVFQKSWEARYFLAATGLVVVGTVVYTSAFLGLLPQTPFTANAAQWGSGGEMVLLAFALGHKIRELRRKKREAEELSRTDPLTGLANRRYLDEHMDSEWRRAYRQGTSLGLVVVDVDHFKAYNDILGHQAGDRLLQLLAEELRNLCRRPGDLAARYGGEEFVLVLPGLSGSQALQFAEKLRLAVEEKRWPHPASPLGEAVTVSCGVAVGRPQEGVPVASLFREADEALYRAKNAGRNRVQLRTASGAQPCLARG